MSALHMLKKHFVRLATTKGYITERDYHKACHGITDKKTLDSIGDWLVQAKIPLKSVGPQYQKEVMTKVKNPNVENIKDTKHKTHKNKDKYQKSKKKEASFNFNELIREKKETDDEFLPSWKRFKAQEKSDQGFVQFLASVGLTAQDWWRPEEAQRAAMQMVEAYMDQIPQDATFPEVEQEMLRVDPAGSLPVGQRLLKALEHVSDAGVLRDLTRRVYDLVTGTTTTPQPLEQEQTFEFDPGDEGPLELAFSLKKKSTVVFANGAKFSAQIAETAMQRASGLEIVKKLAPHEGMIFPFDPPDHVTFHMGSVEFPIDIIFLLEGDNTLEVGKIVHDAQPGSLEYWSNPKTAAVLEISGGLCKQHGIEIGSTCILQDRFEL